MIWADLRSTRRERGLLAIPNVKPFVVQNLGKYERQAWQVAEFPANGKDHLEEQREREAAYRQFILDLYHATPISGHAWLHGTKGGTDGACGCGGCSRDSGRRESNRARSLEGDCVRRRIHQQKQAWTFSVGSSLWK